MSPREKHIPDDALRTSICLTAEDRAAIQWISAVRRGRKDKRTTNNDILLDALWYFLEKIYDKSREQIREMVPISVLDDRLANKVTEMPKPFNKR